MKNSLSKPHLLSIDDLLPEDITYLLDLAEMGGFSHILAGKVVMNLFFENSTRTLLSFELAAKKLGAHVINMQASTSSLSKGESLYDTIMTINAMEPDFVVIRHAQSGSVKNSASLLKAKVINAGDGSHQHPTQALLDALTIRQKFGYIAGLTIAICGDILHSRVARSNILLLTKMGAKVKLIGPRSLLPSHLGNLNVECHYNMPDGLRDADVVMMLRLQAERMNQSYIPSLSEFAKLYGLNHQKLKYAKDHAVVMHPGPMNRDIEITSALADDPNRSLVLRQVTNGVLIRSAIFAALSLHNIT